MIPDLPVLALKMRDYFFWLVPTYALALAGTAAWSAWIAARDPSGYARVVGADGSGVTADSPGRWLLQRLLGVPTGPGSRVNVARQLWISMVAGTLTPLAVALTAAFSPAFALLRLGGGLLLAALVAGGITILTRAAAAPDPPPTRATRPLAPAQAGDKTAAFPILWWRHVRRLFDATLSPLLIIALAGGLFTAWLPARTGLAWLVGQGSLAALPATLLTVAMPFPAGTEVPLLRALQTYNSPPAVLLAILLGAPLLNWACLRAIAETYGRQVAGYYLLLGLAGVLLISLLVSALFAGTRLLAL